MKVVSMPDEKPTNKEQAKQTAKPQSKFTVMPQEFRKAAGRKKIPPKILIFGSIGIGVIAVGAIAVIFLMGGEKKQLAEQKPPVETAPPAAETPKEEPATSTEEESSGLFTPPAEEEKEEPAEPEEPAGTLVQGTDSDTDGLTDKEEAIFQTDTTRPDSDTDSFLDGNEVFHLYNPAAIAPVGLLESGIVKLYRNASEAYTIYYPSLWATSSTSDTSAVSFLSSGAESINIKVLEAPESITLRSWYLTEYPGKDINKLQSYTSKQGYRGLQDENRLNTYIKEGGRVIIINYNLGEAAKVWYRRTYDMMLNSLKIE